MSKPYSSVSGSTGRNAASTAPAPQPTSARVRGRMPWAAKRDCTRAAFHGESSRSQLGLCSWYSPLVYRRRMISSVIAGAYFAHGRVTVKHLQCPEQDQSDGKLDEENQGEVGEIQLTQHIRHGGGAHAEKERIGEPGPDRHLDAQHEDGDDGEACPHHDRGPRVQQDAGDARQGKKGEFLRLAIRRESDFLIEAAVALPWVFGHALNEQDGTGTGVGRHGQHALPADPASYDQPAELLTRLRHIV